MRGRASQKEENDSRFLFFLGPSTGCVLYGRIDQPIIFMNNSKFFFVDKNCAATSCKWPIKRENMNAVSLLPPMKGVEAQSPNHCQTLCLMGLLLQKCRAYAWLNDASYKSGYNCYLFPSLSSATIASAASGDFTFYQNECF
uniref:Apple domain-containing protein n=1 Tax=Plectus sambesii TaxID=2011161 RepID=A0A914XQ38_9BILA